MTLFGVAITWKVVLALLSILLGFVLCIAVIGLAVVGFIFAWIDKRGMNVEFEFVKFLPKFQFHSSRPVGMSREEAEALIDTKVAEAIDSHLSAMESYKDHCTHYDQNLKTLIAHKLDEIIIPVFDENMDPTQQQILALTIKMELLIMNIENHYAQSALTAESLKEYLQSRYERLLKIFERFSDDNKANRKSAFFVIRDWWAVVCPALSKMIAQKREVNDSAVNIFTDDAWAKRVGEVGAELSQIAEVLDNHSDVFEIIRDYFIECSYDVPLYLE